MEYCEKCYAHGSTVGKKLVTREIYVKEIPLSVLKEYTDDEILSIYEFIQNGFVVCKDCISKCTGSNCDKYKQYARYYLTTGKVTQEQIEREVKRRTESRKNLSKFSY